ncbi:molecular chaperone TorD family protein [Campylobacter sputorum]|uniref:molecular chaperone TorD family protein n=1 Tax=Campylobacter sputorum TaxID=206 RepID=UPI000B771E0B|nr:molecular chaperone TorD family protein [Campylobacter sputorum]KAB0582358.1 molecular chaperone TorD family protein [Campylobacter sputorum subsp. sputorum]
MNADFTRLFIADLDGIKAPPFASFYYSTDVPQVYTQNSVEIAQIYKDNKFNSYFAELPADSVSNELLFLEFAFKIIKFVLQKNF